MNLRLIVLTVATFAWLLWDNHLGQILQFTLIGLTDALTRG